MASRAQPPLWRETVKAGAVRSSALIGAIALIGAMILLALAFITYHSGDPSLNTASGGPPENWLGAPGAWVADFAFALIGPSVGLMVPIGLMVAARLWRDVPVGRWRLMLLLASIGVTLIAASCALVSNTSVLWLPAGWGGVFGLAIANGLRWAIDFIGDPAIILWTERGVSGLVGAAGAAIWVFGLLMDGGAREWRRARAEALGGGRRDAMQ